MGKAKRPLPRSKLTSISDELLNLMVEARQEADRDLEIELCLNGTNVEGDFIPGPLYWLQNHTKTFDEKWRQKGLHGPYRSFSRLPYMPWLFSNFLNCRRLFIPKSRDMMVSWSAIGYGVWLAQFHERVRVIVQTQKEDKVVDLIKGAGVPGYARTLYEMQDDWMKKRYPLATPMDDQASTRIAWANRSLIQGVPKGADQIRLYHPNVMIFDEAAHLDEFEAAYGAADPVCQQIIAVSSVAPGWFWDEVHPDGKAG